MTTKPIGATIDHRPIYPFSGEIPFDKFVDGVGFVHAVGEDWRGRPVFEDEVDFWGELGGLEPDNEIEAISCIDENGDEYLVEI